MQKLSGGEHEALLTAGQPDTDDALTGNHIYGYGGAQPVYLGLGWRGVLPLPPLTKVPPPKGFTGRDGDWPSQDQLDAWAAEYPHNANLCLRLNDTTVGIDVDAYDTKTGGQTLVEAEQRWGALPDTWRSSARPGDPISGIRVYRVPVGIELQGQIKFDDPAVGDIEIVQRHHRYMVAWPSVHPKTGQQYRWHGPDGDIRSTPPALGDLPDLPNTWLQALRVEVSPTGTDSCKTKEHNATPAYDVTDAMTEGEPSEKVSLRLSTALYDLRRGQSRHDTMRDHVLALLRHGRNGESGVGFAIHTLHDGFVDVIAPDRPGGEAEAQSEFERLVTGAGHLLDHPDTSATDDGARTHLRDRLLTVGQLRTLPPVQPLINGLLYRDTLAQLTGPPGSYKSFTATAMSCAVAAGVSFGDHAVPEAGRVVYVACEGANAMAVRILAWCEVWGVDPAVLDDRLLVLPLPVQLGDRVDVSQAVELVQEIDADVLVLDTRARCTLGLDENSATEQGRAIHASDEIRSAAGCTVLGVHHSSRSGTAGRGSNAWDGAVWSDLRLEGKALQASITCTKHKDVPSGCVHHFTLQKHTVSAELMPGTLEMSRQTLVLSGNDAGIAYLTANSQLVVLEIVEKSAPAEGLTAKQVIDMAKPLNVSQSAVYQALKALAEAGHLLNVGTQSRSRYIPARGAL